MKLTNYKILFILRVLKNVIACFVDSFLVLYFLDISDRNILPLGTYKLVAVIAIYSVIFLTRNLAKTKYRANLMRIGIVLDFIYFSSIILLKDKVVDYIYLVGLLYGLAEGFYFSVYNILESDGVTNEERVKFIGTYTATEAVLSIIFPLIFGSLIYATGFLKSLIVVFILAVIRIILSFIYKDTNVPKSNKTNMKEFFKLTKKDKRYKQMYKVEFLNGIVFSEAAFAYKERILCFSNKNIYGIYNFIIIFNDL